MPRHWPRRLTPPSGIYRDAISSSPTFNKGRGTGQRACRLRIVGSGSQRMFPNPQSRPDLEEESHPGLARCHPAAHRSPFTDTGRRTDSPAGDLAGTRKRHRGRGRGKNYGCWASRLAHSPGGSRSMRFCRHCRLRQLAGTSTTPQKEATVPKADGPAAAQSHVLDETELRIMRALSNYSHALKVSDLVTVQDMPERKTLGERLAALLSAGFVDKKSKRGGYQLNAKGRDAIQASRTNSSQTTH